MSAKQFEKSEEWTDDNFSDSGEFQDDHVSCFLQDAISTLPLIFFFSSLLFLVFSIFFCSLLLFFYPLFFLFNFVSSVLPSSFLHNILPPPCPLLPIFSFLLKCSSLSTSSLIFDSSLFFSFRCFSSLSLYLSAPLAVSLPFSPPFINLRLILFSF